MKEVMDPTTITRNEDTGGTQEREEGGWQGGGSGRPRSSCRKGEQRREHTRERGGRLAGRWQRQAKIQPPKRRVEA
jgi:hypothetical protein